MYNYTNLDIMYILVVAYLCMDSISTVLYILHQENKLLIILCNDQSISKGSATL